MLDVIRYRYGSVWNTIKKSYFVGRKSFEEKRQRELSLDRRRKRVRSLNSDRYGLIRLNLFEHKRFLAGDAKAKGTENQ